MHRHKVPIHLKDELRKFHEDLYKRGFIEPVYDCEHLSPVVLVKKPPNADGSSRGYRMVVDMRARNQTLVNIGNRMPEISEIFLELKNAKFLSGFDLENGYWLVGLDEKSKRLTAFGSEYGSWMWRCLPQGMVNSGLYFQAWCERLFRKYGILASQQGFADLDRQFDQQQTIADEMRSFNEPGHSQSPNSKPNSASTDQPTERRDAKVRLEERSTAIKKSLEDAKKLKWDYGGFLSQYLDDSLLASSFATWTTKEGAKPVPGHQQHVLQFLRICSQEGLPIQAGKSHIFCRYLRFLGVIVGQGKLFCDPEKIKSVLQMEPPTSQKLLRGFLGAVGWFRLWISDMAMIQAPLNELLKGKAGENKKFEKGQWTTEHQQAFIALKKKLISFPVLSVFNPKFETELIVDASATHVGSALIQRDPDDKTLKPKVVAFWSRALNGAEVKYSSQEREMLAIVASCTVFRHYIMGAHLKVRIYSDHKSLSQITLNKVQANRIGRWNMLMSEFSTSIYYLCGPQNHLGDYLSRAVTLDSDAWERRGPGADTEDKFAFPFLHAWPDIAAEVQRHHNAAELHVINMLHLQYSTDDASDPETSQDVFCAAFIDEYTESAQTQLADEFRDCFPENAFNALEKCMLGFTQHQLSSDLTFEESQYMLCPDFGAIYRRLRYPDPTERSDALKRATDLQQNSCTIPTPKNRQRVRRTMPKNANAYFIENGFLYWQSPLHGPVVCVPHGASDYTPDSNPAGRKHKLDSADGDDDDNMTVSSCDHDTRRLTLREFLIREMHNIPMLAHRGITQTTALLTRRYYWPHLKDDVTDWINGCSTCVTAKINRQKAAGRMQRVQRPLAPTQSVNIDMIVDLPVVESGGIPYSKLVVVVDRCTTRVFLEPLPTHATSATLADVLFHKICLDAGYGVIQEIVSDRDTLLTAKFWQAFVDRLGTKMSMSTSRTQWTNGSAERMIAVVEEMLRTRISWSQLNWIELLSHIRFAINRMPRVSLQGHSALYLERGVEPTLPVDLLRMTHGTKAKDAQSDDPTQKILAKDRIAQLVEIRSQLHADLQSASARLAKRYETERREADDIKTGDRVWISADGLNLTTHKLKNTNKRKKLDHMMYGPYEVIARTGVLSYKLKLPTDQINAGVHDVFHVMNLKKYNPNKEDFDASHELPEVEAVDLEYEVERILNHRRRRDMNEFLVAWKGHSEILASTYVSEAELRRNASELLETYMLKNNIQTDGYAFDNDSDDESQPDAAAPRRQRKAQASKAPDPATGKAKKTGKATARKKRKQS